MISDSARAKFVPLIVACAMFMEHMDSSIIATALPTIAHSLRTDPLHLNLAITTYLLGLSLAIPLSGWLADRFGARLVFRSAIVLFTLSSMGCGLAENLSQLVLGRFIQGLGGAMMVPVGRLVLLRTIEKSKLVAAMSWLAIPALVGPVLGPPLGGFIVTYWSWRWIFYVNLPIGILGLVMVTLFVDPMKQDNPPPLDWRGFLLLSFGLAGLVFGFETVGRNMIPEIFVASLLGVGVVLAGLYVRHARRASYPILDLKLFRKQTFRVSVLGGFLFRIGTGAMPFLLPMMFQLGFGMSPLSSGLLTFVGALGAMMMKTVAEKVYQHYGFRRVLIVNVFISSSFLLSYAMFRPGTPHFVLLGLLFAGGFFRSLQFTGINTLGFSDISQRKMSRATTITSMFQQLAMSFGVAVGALLLHVTLLVRGTSALGANDFWPALVGVSLISLSSVLFYVPLKPEAGAEVSGHKLKNKPMPASE